MLACLLCLAMLSPQSLMAQGKPSLSKEIGSVIEAEGISAAKQRFADLYPAHKAEYEVDPQELMVLGQGYMQAGDMETGMAVMEMLGAIVAEMSTGAMQTYSPQMAEMARKAEEEERAARAQEAMDREEAQRSQERKEAQARGKARSDLDRFKGIYGDPGDSERLRTLFVTVSCDGYLVMGPMWADVGPWWMRSAADTVFTYADDWTSLSVEFSGSGEATTLTHDIEGVVSPAARVGALPSEWRKCMERPLR